MTTTRTEEQTQMLHRVANRIENDPALYDQEQWISTDDGMGRYGLITGDLELADPFDCGTACCIAGWAVLEDFTMRFDDIKIDVGKSRPVSKDSLIDCMANDSSMPDAGRRLLGLGHADSAMLFNEHWKPADWLECDDDITTAKKAAQALRDIANGATVSSVTQFEDTGDLEGPDGSDYS